MIIICEKNHEHHMCKVLWLNLRIEGKIQLERDYGRIHCTFS